MHFSHRTLNLTDGSSSPMIYLFVLCAVHGIFSILLQSHISKASVHALLSALKGISLPHTKKRKHQDSNQSTCDILWSGHRWFSQCNSVPYFCNRSITGLYSWAQLEKGFDLFTFFQEIRLWKTHSPIYKHNFILWESHTKSQFFTHCFHLID